MISDQFAKTVLQSVRLVNGDLVDVSLGDGQILSIDPAGNFDEDKNAKSATQLLDGEGYILLPGPVEPHAHLDKALIANRVPNKTEDLPGAIDAIISAYDTMTGEDVAVRSLKALEEAVTNGFTAVRTHADARTGIGTSSIEALVKVREQVRSVVDLQVVALAGKLTDPVDGPENERILERSIAAGADFVGGIPSLETDPRRGVVRLVDIAADAGVGMDLHVDETLDPSLAMLRALAEEVLRRGLDIPVTASHCVSLGMQDPAEVRQTARLVAEAGISVVTLPQTNLYLQGRGHTSAKPRGLTAISALADAGVTVAGGSDNWRDPFNPMGRIDPLETAGLLITAGHMLIADAFEAVSNGARRVMGLPRVEIEIGAPADLLCVRGSSLADAIARASQDRMVFKAGKLLSRTVVERSVPVDLS